jgi:hypothetical protein
MQLPATQQSLLDRIHQGLEALDRVNHHPGGAAACEAPLDDIRELFDNGSYITDAVLTWITERVRVAQAVAPMAAAQASEGAREA